MMKKRYALLMLAAAVALMTAGCGGGGTDSTASSAAEESEIEMPLAVAKDVEILPAATPDGTSVAEEAGEAEEAADENALIPCKSLAVAAKLAGFEMSVPQSVSGYEAGEIRANGQLIEAAYADGEGHALLLKKSTDAEGLGADTGFEKTEEVTIGGLTVTEYADGSGVRCALFEDDSFHYAVLSDAGLTPELTETIVSGMLG